MAPRRQCANRQSIRPPRDARYHRRSAIPSSHHESIIVCDLARCAERRIPMARPRSAPTRPSPCSCTKGSARSRCGATGHKRSAMRSACAGSSIRARATAVRRRARAGVKWSVDFMHRQAGDVLPALLDTLGVDAAERRRMWLIGHSDGGSIALLYAAAFPEALAGAVVLAPHVTVEQGFGRSDRARRSTPTRTPACAKSSRAITTTSIPRSSAGTTSGSILHFARGTSRRNWRRSRVRCSPSRARTTNTRRWRRSTRSRSTSPQTKLTKLPDCGHSPHRQMPERVNDSIVAYMRGL